MWWGVSEAMLEALEWTIAIISLMVFAAVLVWGG
jgi:hypothetical protein